MPIPSLRTALAALLLAVPLLLSAAPLWAADTPLPAASGNGPQEARPDDPLPMEGAVPVTVMQDGHPVGPLDWVHLVALARNGRLTLDTSVRPDGTARWRTVAEVPFLVDLLSHYQGPLDSEGERAACPGGIVRDWVENPRWPCCPICL